jgi:hypothetical protein
MLRLVALLAVISTTPAFGQHAAAPAGSAPATTAPREASQFDFLVGQWEITVRPLATGLAQRIHGSPRLLGTWKAWRAMDNWGIEDEMRIVDGSGNPSSLSHTLRVFDAAARKWSYTTVDVYRGRITTASGEWQNNRMVLSSRGTDNEGRTYQNRSTFSDITPNGFKFQQDRSFDEGRTWTEGVLRIEAKRTAAAATR